MDAGKYSVFLDRIKTGQPRGRDGAGAKSRACGCNAQVFGKTYPEDQMTYSWKKLMQNHPHDSICGCSVDEVNEEMKTRFAKSRQVADASLRGERGVSDE